MRKVAVKSALSGAALAAALDLYTQRKGLRTKKDYQKGRGAIAALSGAIGGAALSKLLKQIAREAGHEAGRSATIGAKGKMSWLGRKVAFK
tara:strand:- start:1323 stop:1595 length:273 start_codon:yes stop_codon:yes gene_type:complete